MRVVYWQRGKSKNVRLDSEICAYIMRTTKVVRSGLGMSKFAILSATHISYAIHTTHSQNWLRGTRPGKSFV